MSSLYMTTEEFAALIVEALDDQNLFKRGSKHNPEDIAISFASVGESVGAAMSWAISRGHAVKKEAVMTGKDLKKSDGIDEYSEVAHQRLVLGEDLPYGEPYYSKNESNRRRGYL